MSFCIRYLAMNDDGDEIYCETVVAEVTTIRKGGEVEVSFVDPERATGRKITLYLNIPLGTLVDEAVRLNATEE